MVIRKQTIHCCDSIRTSEDARGLILIVYDGAFSKLIFIAATDIRDASYMPKLPRRRLPVSHGCIS